MYNVENNNHTNRILIKIKLKIQMSVVCNILCFYFKTNLVIELNKIEFNLLIKLMVFLEIKTNLNMNKIFIL